MKILIVHSGNNPDTAIHQVDLWRVSHPLKELRKHVDWQIDERPTIMLHAEKYKTAKDFTEEELQKTVDNLATYDVVIGSYTVYMHGMVFALCKLVEDKYKTKFVLDMDDNLFAINRDNIGWWTKMSHEKTHELQTIVLKSKYIITTNHHLAGELKKRDVKNVEIVPNFISQGYKQYHPNNGDKVKIGYFGGSSHFYDVHNTGFTDALERIMHKYKNVIAESAGMPIENYLPKSRYTYEAGARGYKWETEIFPALQFDISVGPLVDNVFNLSKSDIKWQETARMGAAFVGSNVRPYAETVRNGVDGLIVENTEEAWYEALEKLVLDADYRKKIAKNAEERVNKDFALETHWQPLKEAIERIYNA